MSIFIIFRSLFLLALQSSTLDFIFEFVVDHVPFGLLRLCFRPRQLTEAIAPLLSPGLASPSDPALNAEEEAHDETTVGGVASVLGGVGTILETFAD